MFAIARPHHLVNRPSRRRHPSQPAVAANPLPVLTQKRNVPRSRQRRPSSNPSRMPHAQKARFRSRTKAPKSPTPASMPSNGQRRIDRRPPTVPLPRKQPRHDGSLAQDIKLKSPLSRPRPFRRDQGHLSMRVQPRNHLFLPLYLTNLLLPFPQLVDRMLGKRYQPCRRNP